MAKNEIDIREVVQDLRCYVEAADYAGYDPYDALNSPMIRLLSGGSKLLRIGFTQVVRRSSVNLRPLLGVKKGQNPKGIGLFLWGYAKLYKAGRSEEYLERIHYLLDRLDSLKSPECSGNAWGYNFDWQSRAFFRPKGVPTIVNTAFIGHALLDCYRYTGLQRALDMAVPIADFILNDLHRTREGEAFCFSYTPVDTDVVHNANLLGASILARLSKYVGEDEGREAALRSLEYSMKYQQEDGAWYYGNDWKYKWIDSFHTGFNLEAIRYFLDEGMGQEHREDYEKGVKFYAKRFFLPDGTPKYYHDRLYPIDIHCPAEAVCFFAPMGAAYCELTEKVLGWMVKHLHSSKGFFYSRKTRYFTNKVPYMRWSQAWAFHALTQYMLYCSDSDGPDKGKSMR